MPLGDLLAALGLQSVGCQAYGFRVMGRKNSVTNYQWTFNPTYTFRE